MNNFTTSSKLIWPFAIIGVIAVATVLVVAFLVPKKNTVSTLARTQAEIMKPQIAPVAPGQLPSKFPSDMPVEAGAKVTQNYNATNSVGGFQATRVFESTKTIADNLKIYQAYFQKNGYTVQDPVTAPGYTSILGTKGRTQIKVSMNEHPTTKTTTVNISLTELR